MKSANQHLSILATLVVSFSFFFATSCTTVGDMEYGGAVGWWADGFRFSDEPKQMPDPAIMIHKRPKGIMSFKVHTEPDD